MIVYMTRIPDNLNADYLTVFVGGVRMHTSHTESYFSDTAYQCLQTETLLSVNESGRIQNLHIVQPLSGFKPKRVQWECASTCVVRQLTIDKFGGFVKLLENAEKKQMLEIFISID